MEVIKTFRFYAAHRNQFLEGKCFNLHGHTYHLVVSVMEPMKDSITILFEDLEKKVAPLINILDHSLLLDYDDPAKEALVNSGACGKVNFFHGPTSVENTISYCMQYLLNLGLNVTELTLSETDSSIVRLKRKSIL